MGKARILLVDQDEKFLMPLERKFIDEFGEQFEIMVITDSDYLKEFFSNPQSLDILIINEDLYDRSIERHNIANIFILSEKIIDETYTGALDNNKIYKYTSVKEIYNEVVNTSAVNMNPNMKSNGETRVLMVYSPIGGIGKTTFSMGLCAALSKNHKKVIYIGTDNLQTFGYFMNNKKTLESGVEKQFATQKDRIYSVIKPQIVTEGFDIVPPFIKALSSLNIKVSDFINLIDSIKESNEYDYIVIDSGTDFSEDTSKLMGMANNTIVLVGQDKYSLHKLECLMTNIDYSDKNKFIFICNKYKTEEENSLISETFINKCLISEYVNYDKRIETMNCESLSNLNCLQKISFMFI